MLLASSLARFVFGWESAGSIDTLCACSRPAPQKKPYRAVPLSWGLVVLDALEHRGDSGYIQAGHCAPAVERQAWSGQGDI